MGKLMPGSFVKKIYNLVEVDNQDREWLSKPRTVSDLITYDIGLAVIFCKFTEFIDLCTDEQIGKIVSHYVSNQFLSFDPLTTCKHRFTVKEVSRLCIIYPKVIIKHFWDKLSDYDFNYCVENSPDETAEFAGERLSKEQIDKLLSKKSLSVVEYIRHKLDKEQIRRAMSYCGDYYTLKHFSKFLTDAEFLLLVKRDPRVAINFCAKRMPDALYEEIFFDLYYKVYKVMGHDTYMPVSVWSDKEGELKYATPNNYMEIKCNL